ncbi:helix-turn-helix domain-containing protein [Fodinisporobacter ferrooxydans]|uniref:Helix-turn-helix domain-containing protein n=1 Tax=Fodinisporobacter ferrooxydans TaxID=2901836 RepID=A0ABY4CJS8_9BACL|nr:helix-turn-helix domain-containing protein [Alicyclobacillaceae bacterium MYW30-H2]
MGKTMIKLKKLRKRNGYSQKEIADILGISQPGYQKIENGQRRMSLETAQQLKNILGAQYIDDLLDETS